MLNKTIKEFFLYCILLVIFQVAMTACQSIDVRPYDGDGTILSGDGDSFPRPSGYKIDFGKFDLRKEYTEKKVLKNYPQIEKDYIAGLYIQSMNSKLDSELSSYLSIKMVTQQGDVLFDCRGNIDSWRWSRSAGDDSRHYKYFIYYMADGQESGFGLKEIPRDNSTLYLHINYIPSKDLTNSEELLTGSIQLQVGGYK